MSQKKLEKTQQRSKSRLLIFKHSSLVLLAIGSHKTKGDSWLLFSQNLARKYMWKHTEKNEGVYNLNSTQVL